ncbi:hypothetical protein HY477_01935 [Candidatus Uhrbacteria bacterium]|nr:hypothetical protein [Candidatus Uhrbacteria bacterium]
MAHKIGDRVIGEVLVDLFKPYAEEWIRQHGAETVLNLPGLANALIYARKKLGPKMFGAPLMLGAGLAHIGDLNVVRDWMGDNRGRNKVVGLADGILDTLGPALKRWGDQVTDAQLDELMIAAPTSPLVEWVKKMTGLEGELVIIRTPAIVDTHTKMAYHQDCVYKPPQDIEEIEGRVNTRAVVKIAEREAHHPSCIAGPGMRGGRGRDPNVRQMPYGDLDVQGIRIGNCCVALFEQEEELAITRRLVKNPHLIEGVPYDTLAALGMSIHCRGCEAMWNAEVEKQVAAHRKKTVAESASELGLGHDEAGARFMRRYLTLVQRDLDVVQDAIAGGHLPVEFARTLETPGQYTDIEWVNMVRALVPRSTIQRMTTALRPDERSAAKIDAWFKEVTDKLDAGTVVHKVMAQMEQAKHPIKRRFLWRRAPRFEKAECEVVERWLRGLSTDDRLALGKRFTEGKTTLDHIENIFADPNLSKQPYLWLKYLMDTDTPDVNGRGGN